MYFIYQPKELFWILDFLFCQIVKGLRVFTLSVHLDIAYFAEN